MNMNELLVGYGRAPRPHCATRPAARAGVGDDRIYSDHGLTEQRHRHPRPADDPVRSWLREADIYEGRLFGVSACETADGRQRGKSDLIDTETAARSVLAGTASGAPKLATGAIKAIRVLRVARWRRQSEDCRGKRPDRAAGDSTRNRFAVSCGDCPPSSSSTPAYVCAPTSPIQSRPPKSRCALSPQPVR